MIKTERKSKAIGRLLIGHLNSRTARWSAGFAIIGIVTTLLFYLPLLITGLHVHPDGQFAQFFEDRLSWSDLYIGGWPTYADPNSMFFYPIKYFFPASRRGLDLFALTSALIFSYGNVSLSWHLTRSRASCLLSLLCAPVLGFFVAHNGHLGMLQAACYIPWMLLSGFKISESGETWSRWVALLAFVTALSIFAGAPQLTLYGLTGTAVTALPKSWGQKAWMTAYGRLALSVLLGVGMAAVFLLPAARFSAGSMRSSITPATLAQFALRPFELGIDIFPFIAGGAWHGFVHVPYLGVGPTSTFSLVEDVAYVGACLPFLMVCAVSYYWRSFAAQKLMLVFVGALLLAIAPSFTLAASALVHVPVFSLFRAWGRWQILSSIACLQLSSMALAGFYRSDRRLLIRTMAATALAWTVFLIAAAGVRGCTTGVASLSFSEALTLPTLIQLILLVALSSLVICITLTRDSNWKRLIIGVIVILPAIELGFLSRYSAWDNAYAPALPSHQLSTISAVKGFLFRHPGRLLTMSGWQSEYLSPDAVRAAGIPSINWYGPILNRRFARLSGITSGGWIDPRVLNDNNQVLDIYGVRLVEPYVAAATPYGPDRQKPFMSRRRWRLLTINGGQKLFVNTRSLPRVRVVGKVIDVSSSTEAIRAITESKLPSGRPFDARNEAVVLGSKVKIDAQVPIPSEIKIKQTTSFIRASFASPLRHDLLLVVGDNYSPNWHARVLDEPVPVIRVNYNQLGVVIPSGADYVEVWYQDRLLTVGWILTALFTIATGLVVATSFRRK